MFLLLLQLGVHHSSVSPGHVDVQVERRLHQLWSEHLHPDHIPGLVSRVAVQTLLVKPETDGVIRELCPL